MIRMSRVISCSRPLANYFMRKPESRQSARWPLQLALSWGSICRLLMVSIPAAYSVVNAGLRSPSRNCSLSRAQKVGALTRLRTPIAKVSGEFSWAGFVHCCHFRLVLL